MTRDELEHIIRASAEVTDQYEFMIVGSQSILGPVPNPEDVFTMSAEADIYPLQAPELADKIEGALVKAHNFMKPTVTTHKALGLKRQPCLLAGKIACTGFRMPPRTTEWDIA
jgi:hypothetical protein